ncbi:integrase [Streptomyces sp. AK010]|nr:integrase [Streptomyces sp. AK010]
MEERELAPLTQDLYRYLLDKHLFAFADLDLDEITAPRVREWRAERLRLTGAKTITAKAYRLLKAIMETAVDDELITRNPCRIKGAGKEKAAERRIATVGQVDALANVVGMRWRLMVYLGAHGPLRPEELAGLRRRDVDVDHLRLRVRLAEPERMNGRRVQGDTKSEAGTRTVILPAFLRRELRWYLESYAEPGPDGLLFVGEKGAPFRRGTFGRSGGSGGSGGRPGRSSACRRASGSTTSGTPGTAFRRAPGPPSRTRWSEPGSPRRRPRLSISTPTRSDRRRSPSASTPGCRRLGRRLPERPPRSVLAWIWHAASDHPGQHNGPGL